jgi:hypothetical protein
MNILKVTLKQQRRMRNMNTIKNIMVLASVCMMLCAPAFATPSTQIWNPSTDIQALGTVHLGIDNYFTTAWLQDGGYAYPTDVNLTYGALPGLEIGVDSFMPSSAQLQFNAKYGVAENGIIPAYAIGAQNFGFNVDADNKSSDWNILYAVAAKTFGFGRLTGGYYSGNDHVLLDNDGEKAATGFIATWDKAITDKVWLCLDYASGNSAYGSFFYGGAYTFAANTSVIFGYGTFNRHANTGDGFDPVVTTQLDINI